MKKGRVNLTLFTLGAAGYGMLEILWRGYTHWSMLGAGGICFVFFGTVDDRLKKFGVLIKALVGSGFITAIELIFGLIFNVGLKKNVWDYSRLPFNIGGQICLLYSFIWGILSILFMPLAGKINKRLQIKK